MVSPGTEDDGFRAGQQWHFLTTKVNSNLSTFNGVERKRGLRTADPSSPEAFKKLPRARKHLRDYFNSINQKLLWLELRQDRSPSGAREPPVRIRPTPALLGLKSKLKVVVRGVGQHSQVPRCDSGHCHLSWEVCSWVRQDQHSPFKATANPALLCPAVPGKARISQM